MTRADEAPFMVDETRPTVPGVWDWYTFQDRKQFPHAKPKAWRGSSIGYCHARQFLERAGVSPARDLDAKTLRVFSLGDIVHHQVRQVFRRSGLLIQDEVEFYDPEWELSGHMDLLVGGPVKPVTEDETEGRSERWAEFLTNLRSSIVEKWGEVTPISALELKSAGTYAIKKAYSEGPQPAHMMQIATYYLLAQKNPDQLPVPFKDVKSWEVVMIGKEKLGMLQFALTDPWIERTRETIDALNKAWKAEELPACTCGANGSLPKKYCSFYDEDRDRCCHPSLLEEVL